MAINEEITLTVDVGNPYYVGARAYVTQTQTGAVITIIDKEGTTTATIDNGADGKGIVSATLNNDYTLTLNYTDGTSTTTTSIRGEKGDSGVYVGETVPTDPDDVVWINTDIGADTVLQVKNGDTWTPIESIKGDAAGFGTVTATADTNVGTPSVTVTSSGADTAKNFAFAFHNLGYDDSDLQSDMGVLEARMDSFTNLAEGSTTGDAELIDGRVGADGVTYTNIGGAIRGQVSDLKADLTSEQDYGLYHRYLEWEHGGINNATGENNSEGSLVRSRTPDFFLCADYVKITNNSSEVAYLIYYNSSKTFTTAVQISSLQTVSIDVANAYFRIDLRSGLQDTIKVLAYQYASYVDAAQAASNGAVFRRLSSVMFEQGGLKNATGEETTSTSYIRTAFIPIVAGMTVQVSNSTNSAFYYSIHQYDSSKIWISALTLANTSASGSFTFASNCSYIRIVLLKNGYGSIAPSDVGDALISFKWLYNTATTYREPFAYISNQGNFSFYADDVFDGNGRCAWKLTGNLKLKIPNKAVITLSSEQIISSLTSDDVYTDSSSNDWIYLRAGRALTYNADNDSVESVAIDGTTPLKDNSYPVIMLWSGQAVGGLLYDKFLYDMQTIAINKVISSSRQDSISTELNNARHVPHRYNETVSSPLTLLHFSDIHADTASMNRILADAENFSDSIDEKICTGDMTANTYGSIIGWWDSSVLTCIGNHDTASYDAGTGYNWTALSMADRDAYYIVPFESNWGITHTTGTSYYYKDYTSQKIRLIVMDAMLYTDNGAEAIAQTAWLANLLSDAITNNLHVLIAIHAPHGGATPIDCSFSKYGEVTMPVNADCDTPQTVIDAVASAIANGLKFIGYIVGHTHQDNMWDAEGDGKQLMYCITCAAVSQSAQWMHHDQHRSETEDAYNLVTIDTEHTLVKIVRGGGADIDDHMRTRKAICFNYSTGEMVGEVL